MGRVVTDLGTAGVVAAQRLKRNEKPNGSRIDMRRLELIVTGPWRCESEAPDLLRLSLDRLPSLAVLRQTSGISG